MSRRKEHANKKKSEEDKEKKSLSPVEAYITGELAGYMGKAATKNDKVRIM